MKSVMQHSFARIPEVGISRSAFDRSSGYKTTFDAGEVDQLGHHYMILFQCFL